MPRHSIRRVVLLYSRNNRFSAMSSKGKAKETGPIPSPTASASVSTAIEEALSTPLPLGSSIDSSYSPSPISRPPQAHHPAPVRPMPPRLLSGLARSTLPTASLTYANAGPSNHGAPKQPTVLDLDNLGESSTAWRSASPVEYDESFPDLDPTTGLPLGQATRRARDPSLHLQRTITDLQASEANEKGSSFLPFSIAVPKGLPGIGNIPSLPSVSLPTVSLPSVSIPSIPGLPSLSSKSSDVDLSKRNFSTSTKGEDWGTWATGWWSGNKSKVDETLSKEDQADTVEEEQEKHRRKCALLVLLILTDVD